MSSKLCPAKSGDSGEIAHKRSAFSEQNDADEQPEKISKSEEKLNSSQPSSSSHTSSPIKADDKSTNILNGEFEPSVNQSAHEEAADKSTNILNGEFEPSVNQSAHHEEGSTTENYELPANAQITGDGQVLLLPIASALKEQLTCPICADIYEDSVMLHSCGHVFCRKCVLQCWSTVSKGGQLECPLCRAPVSNKREQSEYKLYEPLCQAFWKWNHGSKFRRGLSLADLDAMEVATP